jgi:hypothetical protein
VAQALAALSKPFHRVLHGIVVVEQKSAPRD